MKRFPFALIITEYPENGIDYTRLSRGIKKGFLERKRMINKEIEYIDRSGLHPEV